MYAFPACAATYCIPRLNLSAMHTQAVRLLVACGGAATVNVPESQTGCTPLLLAMGPRCSTELVKLLIDSGADVNKFNYRIETPLCLRESCQ
jgi:ankyrin repeat protein